MKNIIVKQNSLYEYIRTHRNINKPVFNVLNLDKQSRSFKEDSVRTLLVIYDNNSIVKKITSDSVIAILAVFFYYSEIRE